MKVLILALVSLALPIATGSSDDKASWPQWRGPNRDGLTRETDWVAKGKEKPLWSMQVGLGYSTVSVADGRLYTMGYDEETGMDLIWCLDAETGEELWMHPYESKIWNQAHRGGTLSTPSVDGDVVFTLNREGNMYCLEAETGEVVWHQNYVEEEGLEYPTWGFSASPLVLADQVIMNLGRVFSLDKKTGEILWATETNYGHAYSTPTVFELEGEPTLAVFNSNGLAVLSMDGGMEIFLREWKTQYDINAASPIVIDDKIYISSGQGRGNALLQITAEGLKPAWENKSMSTKMSGCVLIEGHLYGFDDSVLKCVDLAGKEKWAERGIGNGALMGGSGKLIVVGSRGELIVAEASPAGFKELSRAQVLENDGVFWTMPVLAGGLIYARGNTGQLVCLDHRATKGEQ